VFLAEYYVWCYEDLGIDGYYGSAVGGVGWLKTGTNCVLSGTP
jgi:hypothetical protein